MRASFARKNKEIEEKRYYTKKMAVGEEASKGGSASMRVINKIVECL